MNSNGYVPFLINMLNTIVRVGNLLTKEPTLVTFFMLLVNIVLVEHYKDFHFLSNLCFGYFLFSNLLLGYNT